MDSKLIEAAEIAAAQAALETGRTDWGGPVPIPNYTRIARAAILAFLDAAAGDEVVVEKMAEALVRSDRNYVMYHMPGDRPRKWRTPGGAIWDTNPLSVETAQRVRVKARAALSALKGEVKP